MSSLVLPHHIVDVGSGDESCWDIFQCQAPEYCQICDVLSLVLTVGGGPATSVPGQCKCRRGRGEEEVSLDVGGGGVPGGRTSHTQQSHRHRAGVDHADRPAGEEVHLVQQAAVHQGAPAVRQDGVDGVGGRREMSL